MPKKTTTCDVLIIGAGVAGIEAALTARELGAKKVAVVEKEQRLGGECPNWGCIPTKTLLRSVEILNLARRAKEFGLLIPSIKPAFTSIMKRRWQAVDMLTGNKRLEKLFSRNQIDVYRGRAVFTAPTSIQIGQQKIKAKKIILATGSEVFVPPIPGLNKAGYITSDKAISFRRLPGSMVIIGGGPVGAEIAQIYAPLGVKITIIEIAPHILPREDRDIALLVTKSFADQGIEVLTSHKVAEVKRKGTRRLVTIVNTKGNKKTIRADLIMVATGKKPATAQLDLAKAGVKLDKKGAPVLNDFLQTSAANIYAAGDVTGKMLFTHVARAAAVTAVTNALKGNRKKQSFRVVPRGTFCYPELGSVGLTEKEAKQQGYDVAVGKANYSILGRSITAGESIGLVKIIVNRKNKQLLGGHIAGHSAAELVHEIALAMQARLPYTVIIETIHAFPAYSEILKAAAANVK